MGQEKIEGRSGEWRSIHQIFYTHIDIPNINNERTKKLISITTTYVDFCIAFIADAPVLKASIVSVVALAPSNIIICNTYSSIKLK